MPDEQNTTVYKLPLTGNRNGQYKQLINHARVLKDDFTRDVLAQKTWHLTSNGYPATNVRSPDGRYKRVLLHHLVYHYYHGPVPPGHEIDHEDKDKTNALPSNLRHLTRSGNMANKGRDRDNTSGYKGVSWNKNRSLWVANIRKNGNRISLGGFADKHEAARRVNAAYREHFPEVAIPNSAAECEARELTKIACESNRKAESGVLILRGKIQENKDEFTNCDWTKS